MNKPSSTITAATVAASGATVLWGLVETFTTIEPSAMLVSGSTAFAAAFAGYLKRETVLPLRNELD